MNPFDLPGPAFLVFYFCLSVAVIWLLSKVFAVLESGPLPPVDKLDTYQIATLRGGIKEAILLAVFSLLDRGLLKESDGSIVRTGSPDVTHITRHRLEGQVLARCRAPSALDSLLADAELKKIAETQEEKLIAKGLCVTGSIILRRMVCWAFALVIVMGAGVYKLVLAHERGRDNIGVLAFGMAIVFCVTASMTFRRRTALGTETLEHLKQLFGQLHLKSLTIRSGGRTNEASQVAAVYGVAALSATHFPFLGTIFKKATQSGSSSSCGGACGSSCGGSCGGGCGGCGGD